VRGITIIFSFLLFGCNHPESEEYNREQNSLKFNSDVTQQIPQSEQTFDVKNYPSNTTYKVIGIKDGDTYELLIDNNSIVVRSAHIDCPEKKQPFGQKAKQFASDLCFGKFITLQHDNKYDRNHRLIAEVILEDGRNLNKLLVENGLAWHYKKYSKDENYAELEIIARQNKIGLWTDPNAINPDVWRH
jgi:micrococcal nuclease